jgi:hypothetical protein
LEVRRIGRYILNGLTVVLLLAWAAATITRLRYNYVPPAVTGIGIFGGLVPQPNHGPHYRVGWYDGKLDISVTPAAVFQPIRNETGIWSVLGVEYDHAEEDDLASAGLFDDVPELRRDGNYIGSILDIPYWLVSVVLMVLPVSRLSAKMYAAGRGRRRLRQGRCVSCGYDMRSTPARCPECGAVPTCARRHFERAKRDLA